MKPPTTTIITTITTTIITTITTTIITTTIIPRNNI